jgi:hypothetical protein
MKGYQKLPMLSFDLKRSGHSVDLATPLKKVINFISFQQSTSN